MQSQDFFMRQGFSLCAVNLNAGGIHLSRELVISKKIRVPRFRPVEKRSSKALRRRAVILPCRCRRRTR